MVTWRSSARRLTMTLERTPGRASPVPFMRLRSTAFNGSHNRKSFRLRQLKALGIVVADAVRIEKVASGNLGAAFFSSAIAAQRGAPLREDQRSSPNSSAPLAASVAEIREARDSSRALGEASEDFDWSFSRDDAIEVSLTDELFAELGLM